MNLSKIRPLSIALLLCSLPTQAYYGPHSTEVTLEFDAQADIHFPTALSDSALRQSAQTRKGVMKRLDQQIQHLMGVFQAASYEEKFGYKGALGEGYEIQIQDIQSLGSHRYQIQYHFKGPAVFEKEVFRDHHKDQIKIPVILPLAADRIYEQTRNGKKNTCTDPDYHDEPDFWYFWDPDQQGCRLRHKDEYLVRTTGTITRKENTRLKYPEYDRLLGDNENGNLVDVRVFFGYITDIESYKKARRRDDAVRNLKAAEKYLNAIGFKKNETRSADDFPGTHIEKQGKGINSLHVFEKTETIDGRELRFRVELLLTDTDYRSQDPAFHHFYRKAVEEADLVIYDGHAGSGENLNIEDEKSPLAGTRLNPKKYQIFFFNGCSTYPYFKRMYFQAKGGSKNLQIITSGLPTYTETSPANLEAFLDPFLNKNAAFISYQRMLQDLERANGELGTYLFGVSGEENTVWTPSIR